MNITTRIKAAWLAFKSGATATGIQTIKLDQNDALLVQTDRILSAEQANKIKILMDAWLQGGAMPVGVLDGGMTITVVKRKHMGHETRAVGGYQPRPYPNPRPAAPPRHP
jgi:hypothetical protein